MAIPIGAIAWGAAGAAALFRTFYRWHRAVVADGFVSRCAGEESCAPEMVIDSFAGKAPVYATASGRVFRTTDNAVYVAAAHEPTVLVYQGSPSKGGMQVQVQPGDNVGIGQQIGLAERVSFAVYVLWRNADRSIKVIPNEPAAWLASRGLTVSCKKRPGGGAGAPWCEAGRKLVVPSAVATCGIRLPTPGAFMLLPVSVTTE